MLLLRGNIFPVKYFKGHIFTFMMAYVSKPYYIPTQCLHSDFKYFNQI